MQETWVGQYSSCGDGRWECFSKTSGHVASTIASLICMMGRQVCCWLLQVYVLSAACLLQMCCKLLAGAVISIHEVSQILKVPIPRRSRTPPASPVP
jgi:hypothetical protein